MPKVNTFNYDTIASWNGSEDLFVVEQPDGTKVATPAMVKQFIEAGDFEATGEVKDGHGNLLSDVADQIAELTANTLTGINIAAYNSAGNQFTAPTDGYVRMELRNTNQYFYLNVNNATLLGGEGHNVTNAYDYVSVFIKKGMKLYYTGTVQTAIFYSLVSE